jgi:hypothetical protein
MPRGLIEFPMSMFEATEVAIADAALGAVKAVRGKVGYINMALDVSPRCDCVAFADMPVVPHLGVFAGSDPVAIDLACVDMARKAVAMPGSHAEELDRSRPGDSKFEGVATMVSGLSEETQINTGASIGLGSREYELVRVSRGSPAQFRFPPDPRPSGVKFTEKFARFGVFPFDRYNGQGFKRQATVDLEAVKHGVASGNGHKPARRGAGSRRKV